MTHTKVRCLVLACGNTVRGDDGLGPWLAQWASERFSSEAGLRVLSTQQWTPELAEEVAQARAVLFLDCAIDSPPGAVRLLAVEPTPTAHHLATHHLGAPQLLALARELYGSLPSEAYLLSVGAGSTAFGESFSPAVAAALPEACRQLEAAVEGFLSHPDQD